jgi:DNA transposition AAA+ family ATPase
MSQNTSKHPPDGGAKSSNRIGKKRAAPFPSADIVKEKLERSGATTEEVSSALWFLDYAKTNKLPTFKALGNIIGRDASTVSKLFSGSYGAEIGAVIQKIDRARAMFAERAGFGARPVVQTSVMEEVKTLCDLARSSQTIAFLHGPNQSGKTTAAETYTKANNHGRTIFVRMRSGGGTKIFLADLLAACGVRDNLSYHDMRDRALRFFGYHGPLVPRGNSDMLLIIDEVHQAMIGRSIRTVTMELIREIHDLCGIGVVLIGTDVLPEMILDARFSRLLGQIANRGVLRRRIPAEPSDKDVRLICQGYGFDEPQGRALTIVKRISQENGIGKLCGYLRMAKKLASNRHQTANWSHFLTTNATLKSWERGDRGDAGNQIEDRSAK